MKKARIGALLTALIIFALFSCDDQLLTSPNVPGGGDGVSGRSAVLDGITASHGEKQSITLTWNANSNATLYYIYKADSPLNSFYRAAETTDTQYKFKVSPGTTAYYRVSFVSRDGRESSQSMYVKGTSLAQPFISDVTDKNESEVTVIWYMDNVSDDTYKGSLLYTVYCFDGSKEINQITLDGSALDENKATFRNLPPNTRYEYQVEAYLHSDQSASEKSMKVDAATARRMRPGAPVNLRASRGTSAEKIELHFELPDMVEIALGDNQFDPKSVYFKISKRRYSASGTNEYQLVCSYFGSIADNAEKTKSFDYTPGETVKWADTSISRGVEYEYQVQSYVDDTKVITADSSKASAVGWALSEGKLSFGKLDYQLNTEGSLYASAQLPLVFSLDHKDVAYDYQLVETIETIGDTSSNNPDGIITRTSGILGYNVIKNYIAHMEFSQKTTAAAPGRGLYSYEVEIKLNGDTIDTVSHNGQIEISEQTQKILVEGFSVQDGYKDKFVFKWQYYNNRKYTLHESADGKTGWTQIAIINSTPDNNSNDYNEDYSYTHTMNVTAGQTKYFAIRPYRVIDGSDHSGQMVYADNASQTLGVPALSLSENGPSYSEITVAWTQAQKADTYRIKYWYTEGAEKDIVKTAAIVNKDNLKIDGLERLEFSFMPFESNTIDVAKAGLEIQVAVDALNEDLRTKIGGSEIATTSTGNVQTRLVGPSQLNPSASKASSPQQIDVSWNKISGANGYYVFRRQFNMNNTAEEGAEAIVYYVPATETSSINVTGKNLMVVSNEKTDTTTVKATASFAASRYTLTDIYMPDTEYNSSGHTLSYRNQQNDMAQGFSYRYYIVPVVNRSGSPEPLTSIEFSYAKDSSNKNTGINYYTLRENNVNITYNGASAFEKDGFTIGFGQDVTATKGTYASSGNVNNGVQITWSPPPRLAGVAGFSPRYNVYRRVTGGSTWDTVNTNINATQTVDIPPTRGVIYEYAVGITNGGAGIGSQPGASLRFIERCATYRDERSRPHYLGYMLGYIKMTSVTRGEDATLNASLGERVTWQSAGMGIQNNVSTDYNWGIDGYTVYIMNRNISNGWHIIADNITNFQNQINQSIVLTPSNTPNVTVTDSIGTITRNLLFVLRDYKHFYRARTYVMNGETKIYGPDHPDWSYQYRWGTNQADHINASNAMENDYVKWGARQINKTEFITIASLYAARGQDRLYGTGSWSGEKSGNASGNYGASGSLIYRYQYNLDTSSNREFEFFNYKDDLQTRCGDWTTFLTINGKGWSSCYPILARPQWYTDNGRGGLDVKGPWDTPNLYTGRIKFGTGNTKANTNLKWGSGNIAVVYPAGTAEENISFAGSNTALDFTDQSSNGRLNTSYWR